MRKIISTGLLVGTFLVISYFFFSNFITIRNHHHAVVVQNQKSTFYFPPTHFQSSNHFHYGHDSDYPINQSVNSSSYGLLTQNKSQSKIRLLQTPSQGLLRQSSYGSIHLLTQNNINRSSSPRVTAVTQNSSEAMAFYAAASRQPFSTPEALMDDLYTRPQYSFPNKDTIPVPTMPLGDGLIPSLILIALFTLGKRNIF